MMRGGLPLLLLLAFAAAAVDAILILAFNVLTAAQTGNTILFAAALARGDSATGTGAALSIVAFFLGASTCAMASGDPSSPGFPIRACIALRIQAAILLALCGGWISGHEKVPHLLLIGSAAFAMGIQSAVVRGLFKGPTTTYVTGVLTTFATGLARRHGHGEPLPHPSREFAPVLHGLIWIVYLAGAVCCGWLFLKAGPVAVLLPAILVFIASFFAAPTSGLDRSLRASQGIHDLVRPE